MSPALIVLVLSLLLGLQPITTDLYLPALPALTEGFGATLPQAQLTLTALLLAFGLSQLVWGPLSDRFGRRPILLWGLAAYVAASVLSTLAPTMALVSFLMGSVLGEVMDGTARPLMYGVWFWSVLVSLAAWTLVQKHGKSEH